MSKRWEYITGGIPDEAFVRGKVPMTKEEVRAVVISKLRLKADSILVDVGAGTGSVSIEAAHACCQGKVYAIEYKQAAIDLIRENREAFQVSNLVVLEGKASEQLGALSNFDRIFVGGSEGETEEIVQLARERLPEAGRMVITAVALETAAKAVSLLKQYGFQKVDVVSLQVARGKSAGAYTLMEGMNPITIISATQGAIIKR